MKCYFKSILAQILQNEQPTITEMINIMFEDGYEFEGQMIYSFNSLRIHEAISFIEDNWEILREYLI